MKYNINVPAYGIRRYTLISSNTPEHNIHIKQQLHLLESSTPITNSFRIVSTLFSAVIHFTQYTIQPPYNGEYCMVIQWGLQFVGSDAKLLYFGFVSSILRALYCEISIVYWTESWHIVIILNVNFKIIEFSHHIHQYGSCSLMLAVKIWSEHVSFFIMHYDEIFRSVSFTNEKKKPPFLVKTTCQSLVFINISRTF